MQSYKLINQILTSVGQIKNLLFQRRVVKNRKCNDGKPQNVKLQNLHKTFNELQSKADHNTNNYSLTCQNICVFVMAKKATRKWP